MLLVSATPFELISGKVLSAIARSLTTVIVVMVAALVVLYAAASLGLVPLQIMPWFFVYVIAEVTILAALASALGAACSTPQDATSFSWVLMIPVMVPFFVAFKMMNEPNGAMATGLSLFPLFTPIAMLVRQLSPGTIPAWQPWVGLAGVVIAAIAISWVAARIFRIGILMQGKTPNIGDLIRWAVRG
jgi:ABC-2 type transport system permease protein